MADLSTFRRLPELYQRCAATLTGRPCVVRWLPGDGPPNGMAFLSNGVGQILLAEKLANEDELMLVMLLLHEVAHIMLDHTPDLGEAGPNLSGPFAAGPAEIEDPAWLQANTWLDEAQQLVGPGAAAESRLQALIQLYEDEDGRLV